MNLEIIGLKKIYNIDTVVDNLTFTANPGEIYALLGTNGSGKTTSLRMMLGIIEKNGGSVLYNGKVMNPRKTNIGYLPEERGLYTKYPIWDQLLYFASLKGISAGEATERIKKLSSRLATDNIIFQQGKDKKSRTKPEELSKGNSQKIQLISALLSDPEILILDEPFSGLDPMNTDLFKKVIREEAKMGKIIIMSSHQMEITEDLCSDVAILSKGKTVLQGHLEHIKRSYGRKSLLIKTDSDTEGRLTDLLKKTNTIQSPGETIMRKSENEFIIRIKDEESGNIILKHIVENGIKIISFTLLEPSLHQLFVEKSVDFIEQV